MLCTIFRGGNGTNVRIEMVKNEVSEWTIIYILNKFVSSLKCQMNKLFKTKQKFCEVKIPYQRKNRN